MELAIQKLAAINLLAIGLSHVFQHRAWAEFFIRWREKGEVGVFYTALLHLPIGSLIVGFHNVWSGIPAVLTVLGWGWAIKGLLYLVYPKLGVRMLNRVKVERSWEFIVPGVLMVFYAAALAFHIYRQ
ncbi:MAG: hypothetical protein AAB401_15585 [Acidobacteriota bacterium]